MKRTLMKMLLGIVLGLTLVLQASSQKLVSTTARPRNATKLLDARDKYNEAAIKFNTEFSTYKTEWQIKPEKLLPHLQEMRKQLDEVESRLLHLDEEE